MTRAQLRPLPQRAKIGVQVRWRLRLEQVVAWSAQHGGRHPKQGDADDREFGVGKWLRTQQKMLKARRLRDDRIRALDVELPGWRPAELLNAPMDKVSFQQTEYEAEARAQWHANLDAVVAFRAAHERLPRGSSSLAPHESEEARLAALVASPTPR